MTSSTKESVSKTSTRLFFRKVRVKLSPRFRLEFEGVMFIALCISSWTNKLVSLSLYSDGGSIKSEHVLVIFVLRPDGNRFGVPVRNEPPDGHSGIAKCFGLTEEIESRLAGRLSGVESIQCGPE